MNKNICSNQNVTINEAWEKTVKILTEELDDSQKILMLIKLVEILNSEMNTSQNTRTALIEKNSGSIYKNKNNDEQRLILKYYNAIQKAQKFASKIILEYVSEINDFTPSDLETFKFHYVDGFSFNQMYDIIPKNNSDTKRNQYYVPKNHQYQRYSDRSNMNKKLYTLLRGFKSRKPKLAKDYTGAEKQ